MKNRLFKGDHSDVATSLNNLGSLYRAQGKYADAETLLKDALDMSKRLHKGDHPDLAQSLKNLGSLYLSQGKYADAETVLKDALDMNKRLYKSDHPQLAQSLNGLGFLYTSQGKYADAETLYKEALEMRTRLHKGNHPNLVQSLSNLADLYQEQGKLAAAEPLLKAALDMSRRLTVAYAKQKAEGEALNLVASMPLYRDAFLSLVRHRALDPASAYDPATAYPALWSAKGTVARVFEQRQLQARAASTDSALATMLAELAGIRRRRAELLLVPTTKDPGTLKQRETDLKAFDETDRQTEHGRLGEQLPSVARATKLTDAILNELQKTLPTDAAVIDFYQYTFFEHDNDRPGRQKEKRTPRLRGVRGDAGQGGVGGPGHRRADRTRCQRVARRHHQRQGDPGRDPREGARTGVGESAQELPAGIKAVYICPDATLCRVPWAALPGDKPGTVLLEDFAIATIPHAPFLLDKLWPQDPLKNSPSEVLVVGGVKYDAELTGPAPNPNAAASRSGDPLLKPGQKLGWGFLDNTVGEADGVASASARKKLSVTRPRRREGYLCRDLGGAAQGEGGAPRDPRVLCRPLVPRSGPTRRERLRKGAANGSAVPRTIR